MEGIDLRGSFIEAILEEYDLDELNIVPSIGVKFVEPWVIRSTYSAKLPLRRMPFYQIGASYEIFMLAKGRRNAWRDDVADTRLFGNEDRTI